MLARLDSAELAEWEAFDRLEPLDHGLRAELAAAIVTQTAANLHRGENAAPYVLDDFRIDWAAPWRETEALDIEQRMAAAAEAIEAGVAALGLAWK